MQLRLVLKAPKQTNAYVRCGDKEYPLTPEKPAVISCSEQETFTLYTKPTDQQEIQGIWRRLPLYLLLAIRDVYRTDVRGNWPRRIQPYTMRCRGAAIADTMLVSYQPSRYDLDHQTCIPPEVTIHNIGITPEAAPNPLHVKQCFWKYCRHVCALAIDACIVWLLCWIMTGTAWLWLLAMLGTVLFGLYRISQEKRLYTKITARLPKRPEHGKDITT